MQETKPLEQLMHLRKLCNHSQKCNSIESLKWELYSPKCFFLQHFLVRLLNHTQEKLVIVSRFNSMLDHIERVLKKIEVDWFRLDGSTVLEKRSNQIETFNRPQHPTRVFLLSAKAGGLGLSLVGASRLILVDLDWNPAQDRQVMARIWREGQTKPVYIYRLIMQGTLEEIILQRQITKTNLSLHVLDGMLEVVNEFNQEELRVFRHPCFDGCSFKLKETFLGCRDDQVLESILNEEESALPMNVMTLKN
ncbi:hypothetical protein HMI54_009386 [Coelomomyces lativittatus]|nr:hypothetical protein HMI54_009386 [Coelomomyces lativittatus]